jgi:hypothetical protein
VLFEEIAQRLILAAQQNIRGIRPMSAAMSACRNWKLCPRFLALDSGRITDNPPRIVGFIDAPSAPEYADADLVD